MKRVALLLCLFSAVYCQDTCPAYNDWLPWTENCLWFPLNEMRQDMLDACQIDFDASRFPTPPPMPEEINSQMPPKCGYCSFKFQCRKREKAENCFPIDGRHETCSEFPSICDAPKVPVMNNCQWGVFMEMLKQCINRPDIEQWKRDEFMKWGKMAPEANCVEKDGRCKCCCHPYRPNALGNACEEVEAQSCQEYGNWNEWSHCMWGLPQTIVNDFRNHCSMNLGVGPKPGSSKKDMGMKMPEGFVMPEKCGYCSFKVRCRKRDRRDNDGRRVCFPLEADKKACGPDDCEGCGEVCTLPKLKNSCNYGEHIRNFLKDKMEKVERMPYWRRRGMKNIAKNLPHGKCVEKDGECKCCCHPYEPNADGTECLLKEFCKLPEELGINIFGDV